MCCRSGLPIRGRPAGKGGRLGWRGQRGGASPFMYGLVLGVTIFSAMAMQQAKKELAAYQARQAEQSKKQAQEVAKAMDFAILAEDQESYGRDYNLERARAYANTSGKTRGEQDVLVEEKQGEGAGGSFGGPSDKVAIAATDDMFLREKVRESGNADELGDKGMSANGVVVYDTSAARDRQVRTSITRLDTLAEQVYAFYAAHLKFPTQSEFSDLQKKFVLSDVWGKPFNYTVSSDGQSGELGFTTPWNYTHSVKLNLKETP